MQINYIAPLSLAWNRMLKSLFKPFHIKKWFVLGFTAFLANLLDWEGGSSDKSGSDHFDLDEIINSPYDAMEWVRANPDWTILIVFGVALIIGIVILLTWLSSRGKFMFLDNVVNDRALVKKPWADFRNSAKSLFLWRLGFGIISAIIIGGYFSYIYFEIHDMYEMYASDKEMIIAGIKMGILLLILIFVSAYIWLFLNNFVIPLMYKNNSSAWIGWSQFMPLFNLQMIHFFLYGIFAFFIHILVFIGVAILGLFTCCIGFVFLLIPYIGSVILLPISVLFRAFSLEFLEQFGEKYKIFPDDSQEIGPLTE